MDPEQSVGVPAQEISLVAWNGATVHCAEAISFATNISLFPRRLWMQTIKQTNNERLYPSIWDSVCCISEVTERIWITFDVVRLY
jgi:hypothetical protein